ncbi:hypothetical protein A2130_02850 [Candidatus Woesebacteria bacterium GWC2_33_12]|uniref:Uncharacterized protein n=1 Tax=Candidatus Woesebacteria bacterium GW2011_GWB1_33_22 TaxID=1618566 RepID=A0A0F9ZM17_9BACT|nr:MAG: hypothetical protein UR29_C0009G0007 [Candidatus Woesebacteria bacterium GW2011_GWC2_33_12]KKP42431.1 MAG: hypothetical protein UR33_C0002G0007 [Candidatus Woesebacteria bacterium GW2011_GWA2_33_20]KKP45174.1 MAG: hypothetical protein UR35_C0002G0007 [Candidatus Woesebacteria bacterium GW2011_GWB1_33_22]KKP46173.1 MAG: hypothetical protein UR37_C0011G0007 [Microgenomates group bacterium GW2011_GWC1_33_28]KKP50843.1 MAG: hypothetical protein UR41_C0002G0007 [Candidatus Woesebacteria bact
MSADQPKFPHLANCTYWDKGTCAEVGCRAQALMNNSVDLGNSAEANSIRNQIENDAKSANCGATPLVRPKFKKP